MKLIEINKKEFLDFVSKQENNNFYQSREWAEVMRKSGWHTYFLGLDHNGQLKSALMMVARELPFTKKRIFYCPRGFVLNMKDLELLRILTNELRNFITERNGIFLKIDPYVLLKEIDSGKYVDDNNKCIDVLRSLGYIEMDSNYSKPHYINKISLDDNFYDNFDSSTKNTIEMNKNKFFYIHDIDNKEELNKVLRVIKESHNKTNQLIYKLEDMYEILDKDEIVKISLLEMDIDKYVENAKDVKEKEDALEYRRKYAHKIILGCNVSICYNNEMFSVCSAMNDNFKDLLGQYNMHYELMNWAKENGYTSFNFFIDNVEKEGELTTYYKNFGGTTYELLGEFDLVVKKKPYIRFYKKSKKHNKKITDFKPKNKIIK